VARGLGILVDPVERDLVEKAIEGLPELQARVIRALYFEGESIAQVAQRCGLSREAIQNLHQRGLKAVKLRLRLLIAPAMGPAGAAPESETTDGFEMLADAGERALLERALGSLLPIERGVICSLYFAGDSEEEVGKRYQLALEEVRALRRRGFHALLLYMRRLAQETPTIH